MKKRHLACHVTLHVTRHITRQVARAVNKNIFENFFKYFCLIVIYPRRSLLFFSVKQYYPGLVLYSLGPSPSVPVVFWRLISRSSAAIKKLFRLDSSHNLWFRYYFKQRLHSIFLRTSFAISLTISCFHSNITYWRRAYRYHQFGLNKPKVAFDLSTNN